MNILFLSNAAPNYHYFFNELAFLLQNEGHKVVYAVDSVFSKNENLMDEKKYKCYEFSDFFKKNDVSDYIVQSYKNNNLNYAILSDFERSEFYGVIDPRVDIKYYDDLKVSLLGFFEKIFEENSIDFVIYENVSNAFAYFAYFVCEKKGAKYLGIGGSRIPGRFSITSDPLNDNECFENFKKIREKSLSVSENVLDFSRNYIKNIENIVPDYMKTNGLDQISIGKKYMRKDKLFKLFKLFRYIGSSRYHNFQVGNPLITHLNLFSRNIKRRFKIPIVSKIYDEEVAGEEFFLYPLHFHPESSTSILAGSYLNEYEVIRNIAFNLPEGVRLYVKDHISSWGYPSMDFYRSLKRLPNVRLLPPNLHTKELIKKSKGVITLTSTVGYEALLLNKRVFLFGDVFYSFHKNVVQIENLKNLKNYLSLDFEESISNGESDGNYNVDFVSAYYISTLEGSLNLTLKGEDARKMAGKVFLQIKNRISVYDN